MSGVGESLIASSVTASPTTGVNAPKRIYFNENRTDIYDPASNSWTIGTPTPTLRLIAKAAVVNYLIYLVGDRTG